MIRVLTIALLLCAAVAGCADHPSGHRGTPPRDPADYHGVPTDDRPPSMLPAPAGQ